MNAREIFRESLEGESSGFSAVLEFGYSVDVVKALGISQSHAVAAQAFLVLSLILFGERDESEGVRRFSPEVELLEMAFGAAGKGLVLRGGARARGFGQSFFFRV